MNIRIAQTVCVPWSQAIAMVITTPETVHREKNGPRKINTTRDHASPICTPHVILVDCVVHPTAALLHPKTSPLLLGQHPRLGQTLRQILGEDNMPAHAGQDANKNSLMRKTSQSIARFVCVRVDMHRMVDTRPGCHGWTTIEQ